MRLTNKTRLEHWEKMIDGLYLSILISISCLFPQPPNSLKDSKFSVALFGEDMDKEMHAMSISCCRVRPLSSSHFRASEQPRNDCLFSPLSPAGACSRFSLSHGRPGSSLPSCLPPLCCQRHTTVLQSHWPTQPYVYLPKAFLCTHSLILKKSF